MANQGDVADNFRLIDLILAHNKINAQQFLKENGFHFSGTKEDLRHRLRSCVNSGDISGGHLVALLDKIEGYDKQRVYLFQLPSRYVDQLRRKEYITSLLDDIGISDLYNNFKSLQPSDQPELISVTHNSDWLKIRWASKKEKLELIDEIEEEDEELREFLIKRYLRRIFRATTLFQVSLLNGNAELMIPDGSNYSEEIDNFLDLLNKWFKWGILDPLSLYSAISGIESLDETRLRSIGIKTARGCSIDISSPSIDQGLSEDPDASNVKDHLPTGVPNKGNFYWLKEKSEGLLSNDFHTIIYGDSVAITRECRDEEVNYVLGRIRSLIE